MQKKESVDRSVEMSALNDKQSPTVSTKQQRNSEIEVMKLTNFEVYVSMLKYTAGQGVFYRPYLYNKYGLFNSLVADIAMMFVIMYSNINLIYCMNYMPKAMTTPQSNLTYGKVVEYCMD